MKIINVIYENPRSDYQMRQMAMQVLRQLVTRQHEALQTGAMQLQNKDFFSVAYTKTNLPDLLVGVVLGIQVPMYLDDVKMIAFPFEYLSKMKNIDARSATRRAKAILPKTVKDLLRYVKEDVSAFIHEFTHYWDEKRAGEGYSNSQEYDDETNFVDSKYQPKTYQPDQTPAYYNDQYEQNAFFNQMISKFDKANPGFFQQPFPQWLKYIVNQTFPKGTFWEQLTPQNRKRLINRAYMIWAEKQQQGY